MEQFRLFIRHMLKRIDWFLAALVVLSASFGLILISSATATFGTKKLLIVQAGGILLGLLMCLVLLTLEHENLAIFHR